MFGLMRNLVISLLAMAVLYVVISIYSRSVRRERLEKDADVKIAEGTLAESARDGFIEDGMAAYEASPRRKLIALVFLIPFVVIGLVTYLTNFY
ncbi:hypothetical protein ACMU_14585 [Actibacterium mucosum KCTC 23349]|uniref:Cation/multidrug efflux pump n=1 Tax=Actibacterium mucosum KCTC 23349 TaxID=1454373 RepID=A0A037ZFS9_9RHOB|nr:hypothetical protein ACMU_14585 [Actibacterium mucosum KCTC 23349]